MVELHPSTAHVLQFFKYDHLPARLQFVSRPFHRLAFDLAYDLPQGPELTVALRKLLEAKDCAVRARLQEPVEAPPVEKAVFEMPNVEALADDVLADRRTDADPLEKGPVDAEIVIISVIPTTGTNAAGFPFLVDCTVNGAVRHEYVELETEVVEAQRGAPLWPLFVEAIRAKLL